MRALGSLVAVFGIDRAAMKAARRWTFKPAKRDGKAVAVRVPLEMTYTRR